MLKLFVFLSVVILIVGCSGTDNKHTLMPDPTIPETLIFTPSEKGQKLSKEQMNDVRLKIGARPQMEIPDLEMIFSEGRFKADELTQKELELKDRDVNSYNFLKDIQAGCLKEIPATTAITPFSAGADWLRSDVKTGDVVKIKSAASLSGTNCPVYFIGEYDGQIKVKDADRTKETISLSGNVDQRGQLLLLSSKYQNILNAKGLLINTNVSGMHITEKLGAKTLLNYNVVGKYISLDADIPFSFKVSVLNKRTGDGMDTQELVVKGSIALKRESIVIDIHQKLANTKYFVNGYEVTASEFETMFGLKTPLHYSTLDVSKTVRKN